MTKKSLTKKRQPETAAYEGEEPASVSSQDETYRTRQSKSRWLRKLFLVAAFTIFALFGLSMTSARPTNLGVNQGQGENKLAECPESPNCVSTQTENDTQRMDCWTYEGDQAAAINKIKQIVAGQFSRAKPFEENESYLAYEFTSLVFRFVDDVEFLVDDEAKLVHFRSASRVGHSDLGVNRRRMMKISKEFNR